MAVNKTHTHLPHTTTPSYLLPGVNPHTQNKSTNKTVQGAFPVENYMLHINAPAHFPSRLELINNHLLLLDSP